MTAPEDIIRQTDAILQAHEHWRREPDAQAKLKALWGAAINDSGVFANEEEEVLFDKNGCKAVVSIAGANGLYAFGCSFSYPFGGFCRAPSITGELFFSRDTARTAAIQSLLKQLPTQPCSHEKSRRENLHRVRQSLESLLAQPSLF